jgi:hypothetical protein
MSAGAVSRSASRNASSFGVRSDSNSVPRSFQSYASGFVKCSGGHLACDGTVQIRNGRRFHQCYCGCAGFIEGSIKTIEVDQHTFSVEPNVSRSPVENCESGDAAKELPKTSRKTSLGATPDGVSETPKLPFNSSSPRSRNQR